jgi:hypothetical protein
MRKIICLTILLVIFSCATSRKKDLVKEEIKTTEKQEVKYSGTAEVDLKSKTTEYTIDDLSKTNISITPLFASDKCSESTITITDSKGNKSVIPVLPNSETKISNEQQKSQTDKTSELQLAQKSKEILDLKTENEELRKNKTLNVESKRDGFWLYVLIFLGGIAFTILIQQLWKRAKQSQWYVGVLAKLKRLL